MLNNMLKRRNPVSKKRRRIYLFVVFVLLSLLILISLVIFGRNTQSTQSMRNSSIPVGEMYLTMMDIDRSLVYLSDQKEVRLIVSEDAVVTLKSSCGSITGRYSSHNDFEFDAQDIDDLEEACRGLWHKAKALDAVHQFNWLRGPRLYMNTADGQYAMNWQELKSGAD